MIKIFVVARFDGGCRLGLLVFGTSSNKMLTSALMLMFMEWDVPNFGIDSRFSLRSLTGFVFLAVSFLVVSPYDMIEGGPFQVH